MEWDRRSGIMGGIRRCRSKIWRLVSNGLANAEVLA